MIGTTLSHFRITAKLGEGGMGEVYRAEDTKLGREVALKMLRARVASDPLWLERFEREARAVASLNHPNIVTIHSLEHIEGIRFFSMELVDGKTLAEILPTSGLPLDSVWEITVPLVAAVAAAHAVGITHRDLKPGNVMVSKDGRVKVLDFGIARLAQEAAQSPGDDDTAWALTTPGVVLGTLQYMAPEQAQGRPADSRADVFSLGVILFEMITGERPFQGGTPADLMSSILRDDPPIPSQRRSESPRELDRVILKCLEKDPSHRYRAADVLQTALEEVRKGRSRAGDSPPLSAPSIAVLPFVDMSAERDQDYFCEGMAEEIINALTGIKGLRVVSRTTSFRFRESDSDIQSIGAQMRVDAVVEGSVRKAGSRLRVTAQLVDVNDGYHVWSRKFDRELEDVFAIQDDIAQNVVEALRVELSTREQRALERSATSDVEAYDFFLRGRKFFYEGTRKGVELAREMFSRAVRRDPSYALAYAGLASCHSYLYMYFDRTPTNKEQAAEASRKALELGEGLADVHAARGLALSLDQEYDQAGRQLEAALELNPRLFEAHYFYGRVWREQGNFERAARCFEQASRVRPEDYQSLALLAGTYTSLGWPEQAREAQVRARSAIERHLETHPDDARALYAGAGTLIGLGAEAEGLALAKRALDIDPHDPRVLYNLACVHCDVDRTEDAVDFFVRAIDAGYASREWIENDSDLDPIRSDPRFRAALKTLA